MKKSYIIIGLLIVINVFGISNVSAVTNPYKENGPYGTNCTWYAWKMASEKAGVTLPGWGNAKNWYQDAKNSGYTVGTTPKANSIIVWGGWTSYGHVGYVEKVEDGVLYVWDSTGPCIDRDDPEFQECMANGVSEESDKICYQNAKRIACEYTISPDLYGITGYIYLDYAPVKAKPTKAPTSKPTPSATPTSTPSPNVNTKPDKEENSTSVELTKSSNANLSNIVLSSGTIQFDKEVLEYRVKVENEVDSITINATLEDKKAKVEGTGHHELDVGLNEIKLTITAEDASVKEYILQVTRSEKMEFVQDSDIENNQTEEVITKNDSHQTMILVSAICFLILVASCFIFVFKRKIKVKKANKSSV